MDEISFMQQEDAMHLQRIIQLFKEKNEQWNSVRMIIIDKDFTDYKVLKEEFPNAVILYGMLLRHCPM